MIDDKDWEEALLRTLPSALGMMLDAVSDELHSPIKRTIESDESFRKRLFKWVAKEQKGKPCK